MLHLKLVNPERVLFEEDALSFTVPTQTGEITILPHHAPIVSALADGVAELKRPDGSMEEIAISGGTLQVQEDGKLLVLADMAERGEDLDLQTIEKAKARAEALIKETSMADEEQYAEAVAYMSRELAKYKAALRYQKRKGFVK